MLLLCSGFIVAGQGCGFSVSFGELLEHVDKAEPGRKLRVKRIGSGEKVTVANVINDR